MNKLNALYGDKPYEPPRERNSQNREVRLKYHNPTPNKSSVVSNIMDNSIIMPLIMIM